MPNTSANLTQKQRNALAWVAELSPRCREGIVPTRMLNREAIRQGAPATVRSPHYATVARSLAVKGLLREHSLFLPGWTLTDAGRAALVPIAEDAS